LRDNKNLGDCSPRYADLASAAAVVIAAAAVIVAAAAVIAPTAGEEDYEDDDNPEAGAVVVSAEHGFVPFSALKIITADHPVRRMAPF